MKREHFTGADGKHISLCVWDEVQQPKGVLQLVHGMAEHAARYDDFACYLNQNGWIVVGDDHRAHGETDPNALGLAGQGDLFDRTVTDEKDITKLLRTRYKLPVVILGHSYGSFLTQRYLTKGTQGLSGCILMGSAAMEGLALNYAYHLAFKRCAKDKGDDKGTTFANQTFVKYDKKIGEGKNAWLSRDVEQVGKFNTDEKCGFVCSNAFYKFMFGGLKSVAKDKGQKIDKSLKLLIVSGDNDHVGGCGKLVDKLAERYTGFGLTPKVIKYPGARHELLNETNRAEVYADVLAFMDSCL